ncbi:hypothetical protein ACQEUU_14915 [Nonomuraea sp. CA-218870]|uniref:hypothetical protein n=1 Tax=Nonomuraea sp. CA-218870 TaxID=3239998 RepID=UPI003D8D95A9
MRGFFKKAAAVAGAMMAASVMMVSPASAATVGCRGECATGAILSNRPGNYIDVLVINDRGLGYCKWTVRDANNHVVVDSGTTWASEEKRIHGLYNAYYLTISNRNCYGYIYNRQ